MNDPQIDLYDYSNEYQDREWFRDATEEDKFWASFGYHYTATPAEPLETINF